MPRTERLLALVLPLVLAGCAGTTTPPGETGPEAPARAAGMAPGSLPPGPPAEESKILKFDFRVPAGEEAPVYESMRPDSPVAFYAREGMTGILISSATFRREGREFTYWEVETAEGDGWVFEGFVANIREEAPSRPREAPAARAAEPRAPPPPHATGLPPRPSINAGSPAARAADPGAPPPPDASGIPPVRTINADSPGERIDLAAHVVRGRVTVFDFYSEFCGPCRLLSPRLEALARRNPQVVIRKVDINRRGVVGIDWDSPIAEQHRLQSVPWLVVYDTEGRLAAEGDAADSLLHRLGL